MANGIGLKSFNPPVEGGSEEDMQFLLQENLNLLADAGGAKWQVDRTESGEWELFFESKDEGMTWLATFDSFALLSVTLPLFVTFAFNGFAHGLICAGYDPESVMDSIRKRIQGGGDGPAKEEESE